MSVERPASGDEAFWREYLTRGDPKEIRARRVLRTLPHGPRCKLCAAPFAGAAAPLMRAIGKRPAFKNPTVCSACFDFMEKTTEAPRSRAASCSRISEGPPRWPSGCHPPTFAP
jgi:hypothetical protein